MKKLKNIRITVTYSVGLGDLNLNEKEFKELKNAYENNETITPMLCDERHTNAYEWLTENAKEADCFDWKCEVDVFEE